MGADPPQPSVPLDVSARREVERRLRAAASTGLSWTDACEQVFEDWVSAERGYEGPPAWTLYAVAAILAPVEQRAVCAVEASFMRGRLDMKEAMQRMAARRRTAEARSAAMAPRRFSDEELLEAIRQDVASGRPARGRQKRLALSLECTGVTIARRLKALNMET